jgi:8-oxo-dGTP pyrophosphatase MutT (NUDIX family)
MATPQYIRAIRQKIGHDLLMVCGVSALIFDSAGRILLHRRSDNGKWCPIGGMVEPGEEPADAVVREAREETGLEVLPERLVGVYELRPFSYPNGDQVCGVLIAFACRVVGGRLGAQDDETLELRYFAPDQIPDDLRADQRQRMIDALDMRERAFFRRRGSDGGQ